MGPKEREWSYAMVQVIFAGRSLSMSELILRAVTLVSGITLFFSTRALLIERRATALHGYGAMDFSRKGTDRFRVTGSLLTTAISVLLLIACIVAQLLHIALF